MANNTVINLQSGGDIISDDQITTLNGGGIATGEKAQRVKLTFGTPGTGTDVTAATGLPTSQLDSALTASLTATDVLGGTPNGTGGLINTAPTAGSFVALAIPGGGSQVDVQILGTATGTYYFEHSIDSTTGSDGNWIATNFRQTGIVNTVLGYSFTVTGVFRGNSAGFKWVRVRNVGGTSPSNAVTIRVTNGHGSTFQNASTPAGSNIIGKVGIDQTTPGTTNLVAVSGTVPVSLATNTPTLQSGSTTAVTQATAANLNATVSIAATQTLATVTTVSAVTAITNAVNIGSKTTGGLTTFTLISTATTNATSVKASAGTLYGLQASNTGAAVAFVKLYNLATAPTVGTSVAVKTLIVPAGGGIVLSAADIGVAFGTGIALAITGLATTADVTAVALSAVVVNLDYA